LYEAKLNKAKLERAEMSTDFTKERLELHKSLVEAKEHIEILLKREDNMMEQIDLYKQQATELHSALVITIFIQLYPVRWKFKSSLKSIC
jgi:hypothetical protein